MTWSICSEAINMHWNRGEFPDGMPPIYKELMPHLDIMVYNGAGNALFWRRFNTGVQI